MNPGDLRHRIEIGRYIEGTNEWGDPELAYWESYCQVWALVEGLKGSLYFEALQTVERSDHKVVIRYRKGIEPGMVVRHDGRELIIQSALDEDGRRRWLTLICREVEPA